MRCASCGYQNVSHASKCVKCNEFLTHSNPSNKPNDDVDVAIKKTVIGRAANPEDYIDASHSQQLKSSQVEKEEVSSADDVIDEKETLRGTINPWNQPKYETIQFVPMAREGQEENAIITFKNDVPKVDLNRENLDPENLTITRRVQAELTFSDGQWKLENKSSIGTFIKLNQPHTLKDGDQILMGDRIFTVTLKK